MFRIRFLGTCGTQPYKARSASAIFVKFDKLNILLDVGENVVRQLLKYGESLQIDVIFITHLHGDHIYGLFGLIDTLNKNNRRTDLIIYGPASILKLRDIIQIMDKNLCFNVRFLILKINETIGLGPLSVTSIKLVHSTINYGYLFKIIKRTTLDNLKIEQHNLSPGAWCKQILAEGRVLINQVEYKLQSFIKNDAKQVAFFYTGDTAFRPNLIPKVKTIIHECTYYDDVAKAELKKHTAFTQLSNFASKNTETTFLLTHISEKFHSVLKKVYKNIQTTTNLKIVYDGLQYFIND